MMRKLAWFAGLWAAGVLVTAVVALIMRSVLPR
jgi:hypothetical protein